MTKVLVAGSINVDFTLQGIDKFPEINDEVDVDSVQISAGGKSRNIAEMMSAFMKKDEVEFLAKIAKDPYRLYEVPIKALEKAGVSTRNIFYADKQGVLPGMAFIPVDRGGNNAIFVYEGANRELNQEDIQESSSIFEELSQDGGLIVLALEIPISTASFIVDKANKKGIKVMLEPGGIREKDDFSPLVGKQYFLIKPNHTEVEILTGIKVNDFGSAQKAGERLMKFGAKNVMITLGSKGSFFMNDREKEIIPIDELGLSNENINETGAGDQVMATLAAYFLKGYDLISAAKIAVTAGTLQYHKPNIDPVTQEELERFLDTDVRELRNK